jgi:hypothetical protein
MIRVPLARYPGMNRFVLDWLGGDARFLPRRTPVTPRARNVPRALVDALRTSNRHWGLFIDEPLERWASGETLTFVAGQQVGFAGGPLYTLAKLATLVKMKREAEANGTPATAFFWLATEDHDFDEVAALNVPVATLPRMKDVNRQLDLVCMRAVHAADGRSVVGSLPVPESLVAQLLALRSSAAAVAARRDHVPRLLRRADRGALRQRDHPRRCAAPRAAPRRRAALRAAPRARRRDPARAARARRSARASRLLRAGRAARRRRLHAPLRSR